MRLRGPGRQVVNKSGSALADGDAVALKAFNVGSHLIDVTKADSNSATALYKRVIGFADGAIADNAVGYISEWLVVVNVATNAGTAGDYVYLKDDASGDWEIAANADAIPMGTILRSHATTGVVFLTTNVALLNGAGTITYAMIQDVSATDKVLGRSTAGAGDIEEIACTAFGRSLIDDANAAAGQATLGVPPNARLVTAGAGLTGGGDLSADRTLDVVANADGSIVANANDIQLGRVAGATAPAAGATEAIYGIAKLHAAPAVADTPVVAGANLVLTAGAGLAGGGDLTAARTFDVAANADGSIVVNANDVQLGRIAGATAPAAGATSAIYGVSKLHAAPAVADTPVVVGANFTLTSGNGLTGGGDLTADRTLAVGAGAGITVNADDVQIDIGYRMRQTGSISSAQLLALRGTPIELVGAPAAENILILEEIVVFYDYALAAYTITAGGDDLAVRYSNGAGAQASATIDTAGLLDQVADKVKVAGRNASDFVAVPGASLVLHNIGANEWTVGGGALRYDLVYRKIATGF